MEPKQKKNKQEIDSFIDLYLDFTGGDVGLIKVLEKEVSARAYRENLNSNKQDVRFIKQNELNEICGHLLCGEPFDTAISITAEELNVSCSELHQACKTNHKREFLNNMYDKATEEHYSEFREMRDGGYLKKSDYKGKIRPRTGLKNIERAVKYKSRIDDLETKVEQLENELTITNARGTVVESKVDHISTVLQTRLSDDDKIAALLESNYPTATIMKIIGCNKHKVSRVRLKLQKQQ